MRPTRRAATKAALANRKMSLSSISSPSEEEDEIDSGSELENNDTNNESEEANEIDEMEDVDDQQGLSAMEEEDELESLSEEEDLGDDIQVEQQEVEEEEPEVEEEEEEEEEEEAIPPPRKSNARNKKRKKPTYENSDEELIFSDDEETEVLRNKPMTKRQRAKMNRETPEEYLELPMDTGKKKFLTEEEEQLRRSEVARRRKNQSIQRAEKDKADTINRLLKKQATKSKRIIDDAAEEKETPHEKLRRLQDPNRLRYIDNKDGCQLIIPAVYTIEQVFGQHNESVPRQPRQIPQCQVEGCSKDRKYTAKKSGKYVCSLEHYKIVEAN